MTRCPSVALFFLMLAAEAGAATFSWDMTKPGTTAGTPCDPIHDMSGPITINGITATFGRDLSYGYDCDAYTWLPLLDRCPCDPQEKPLSDIANEPSPPWVGAICLTEAGNWSRSITFDPPIRYFRMRYSGSAPSERVYTVEGTQESGCDTLGHVDYGPSPNYYIALLPAILGGNEPAAAVAYMLEPGVNYLTGCVGDPDGGHCAWPAVEVFAPEPCSRVKISVGGAGFFTKFYFDDIVASDDIVAGNEPPPCPTPPCEFEAAQRRARGEGVTDARRSSWGRVKSVYR